MDKGSLGGFVGKYLCSTPIAPNIFPAVVQWKIANKHLDGVDGLSDGGIASVEYYQVLQDRP